RQLRVAQQAIVDEHVRRDQRPFLRSAELRQVDRGVFHTEPILEAMELGRADVKRRLATLEPGWNAATGPGLLALGAAAGGLAPAGSMPSSQAARRLVGSRLGTQFVQLRDPESSDLAGRAGPVTSSRKATLRIMPRFAGVSSTSTVSWSRCSPSARMVPRAAALCPMLECTHVTRSVPSRFSRWSPWPRRLRWPRPCCSSRLSATAAPHRERRRRPLDHLVRRARLLGAALAEQLLAALAAAGPHHAVAIANDHHRAEAEAAAALDDLGNAVDLDDLLFQVELGWIDSSHEFLRYRSRPPSRAPSASERTRPWYWYPPRSRTTALTPAALARSASALPTACAGPSLPFAPSPPVAPASAASREGAAARVRPVLSSTTWA